MKAILIDPFTRTVTEVEHDNSIDDIYAKIDADTFDCARFNKYGDGVYVDDNGLLKSPTHFFQIEGYPQPLTGKGLVLGCDAHGESIAPHVTAEWVKKNVRWFEKAGPFLFEVVDL